jgi:hypothetical protein
MCRGVERDAEAQLRHPVFDVGRVCCSDLISSASATSPPSSQSGSLIASPSRRMELVCPKVPEATIQSLFEELLSASL